MNKRLNVLFVIPDLSLGGAQRSLSKISNLFSVDHNVFVCLFNDKYDICFNYGGDLLYLNVPNGKNLFTKSFFFISRCLRLRKIKKIYCIEKSISYLEGANYINILSKYADDVFISVRGSMVSDRTIVGLFGKIRLKFLIPLLYRFSDIIIALNHSIKYELVKFMGLNNDKITVIYNLYDIDKIEYLSKQPIPSRFEKVFNSQTLITAGRLAPEKGYYHLLNVFSQLKKINKPVKLIMMGNGSLRTNLIDYSRSLNLNTFVADVESLSIDSFDVLFLGYQKNPFKYFSRSSALLLTSYAEGGPNVLSEAMICGTPVISSNCPSGPREKLDPMSRIKNEIIEPVVTRYGILMPTWSNDNYEFQYQVWAKTINMLLSDSGMSRRFSSEGRRRMEEFSVENIFQQWKDTILYRL